MNKAALWGMRELLWQKAQSLMGLEQLAKSLKGKPLALVEMPLKLSELVGEPSDYPPFLSV
jgi:hypothetical protein